MIAWTKEDIINMMTILLMSCRQDVNQIRYPDYLEWAQSMLDYLEEICASFLSFGGDKKWLDETTQNLERAVETYEKGIGDVRDVVVVNIKCYALLFASRLRSYMKWLEYERIEEI